MSSILLNVLLSGVTVTLPMQASVRGTEVELGEIATVEGADAALVQRLAALELGYAPAPGYSRLLVRERIAELVRERVPEAEVRFVGERACRIRPEVAEVASEALLAAARAELSLRFAGRDASFEPAEGVPAVAVPIGAGAPRLRARVTTPELATGTVSVPVEVLVDDVCYRTVWTSWKAEVWHEMPVLARPVKAGETLDSAMFERRRVAWEGGPVRALPASALSGSVATRDLVAGEVVTERDVRRPTVLLAGSTVFLRVKKGAIEARVSATTLDSGAVGDRVRVRTASAGQELYARVVSADLVEVDLGR